MKLKLSKSQLDGLVLILTEMVADNTPMDMQSRVVFFHVKKAYDKMRSKSELFSTPRAGFGITLTEQEACCLHLFIQSVFIPVDRYRYEAIQVQSLSNQIHQTYGYTTPKVGASRGASHSLAIGA